MHCLFKYLKGERYNRAILHSYALERRVVEMQLTRLDMEEQSLSLPPAQSERWSEHRVAREKNTASQRLHEIAQERDALQRQLKHVQELEQDYKHCGFQLPTRMK